MPGSRRAIKARYTRLDSAAAHLRYVLRDGITPDGQPGRLYNEAGDNADGKAFLARSDGDPHQFRFIISAEDSDRLPELKPMIRDLMRQREEDLGVKLGRVVGVGLVDEITDRQYVVVDGTDGRVHYAELGRRAADAAPWRGPGNGPWSETSAQDANCSRHAKSGVLLETLASGTATTLDVSSLELVASMGTIG